MFYIDIALEATKKHPEYKTPIDQAIKATIDLDNILAYGMGKLEHERFLKALGGLFK